jgi:glutathione-specific gamma-glutamylcyclotransferase
VSASGARDPDDADSEVHRAAAMRAMPLPEILDDLWVFAYGSLMWRPGFTPVEQHAAWLNGYHRALCVYSHVHRGTPERPGLVLGLDHGGSCRGIAFRVAAEAASETIAYLREREQATSVYLERMHHVALDDGRHVRALIYVADREHRQYTGHLSYETMRAMVIAGEGRSGRNPDYVRETHLALLALGVRDPVLARLCEDFAQASS